MGGAYDFTLLVWLTVVTRQRLRVRIPRGKCENSSQPQQL